MYRIHNKGLRDFNWNNNPTAKGRLIKFFSDWCSAQGMRANPKFDPRKLVASYVDIDPDPYGYLSDFIHANPIVLGLSMIYAQERLNFNVQWDFKAVSILLQVGIPTLKEFAMQYPTQISKSPYFEKSMELGAKAERLIRKQERKSWGQPKDIPNRDDDL
ncbi:MULTISPECIES: hypothetical protein [Corynebacterium]|uniref:hypothetical protein n=1 Tax=Corynebacterium TaxID=1716 RepID=UPI0008A61725|nr:MULTISPECIES: hypothetical protein [Corynebacterium]MCT1563124.1 hypothetical protein [Corynebacterium glucuronolyticum]OFO42636.1 hypothetical protein HMPREF3044_05495 [Corynebacterium sp. HMSC073D01]